MKLLATLLLLAIASPAWGVLLPRNDCIFGATATEIPFIAANGDFDCEADFTYDASANELNVGSIALDPVAGKNVVRFPGISGFTGPDPSATEALLYCLSTDQECYVENLDGLNAPSRVVTASPDFYDVVLSWGVAFEDVDNEYVTLAPGPGTPVVQTFCMVKASFVDSERTYSSNGETDDVVIPLTGTNACSIAASQTRPKQMYPLMGDPYVKDAWCTTHTNLASGATLWATGDEVVVRFGVSNTAEVAPDEYLASIHDMTFGFDEIDVYKEDVGRHTELRDPVNAFASSALTGTVDPGGIKMAMFTAHIIGMTRAAGSTWNAIQLQCSLGIMFKDTR